jgi:tetratricopeptide (TPR) repeat protein
MGTGSSAVIKIKQIGNDYFTQGDYLKARKAYSKALKLDAGNVLLLSNRSACCIRLNKLKQALDDALLCVKNAPAWHKSYYRLAVSLKSCGLISESLIACQKALMIEEDGGIRSLAQELQNLNPLPSRNNLLVWGGSHVRPTLVKELEGIPVLEM